MDVGVTADANSAAGERDGIVPEIGIAGGKVDRLPAFAGTHAVVKTSRMTIEKNRLRVEGFIIFYGRVKE